MGQINEANQVRLDKWLWAARFYKTRQLAQEAVNGGKVHLNHKRVKASHTIKSGDVLSITKGTFNLIVIVKSLSDKRGPAKVAQQLYEETEESIAGRELRKLELKSLKQTMPIPSHKPNKKERQQLRKIRGKSKD